MNAGEVQCQSTYFFQSSPYERQKTISKKGNGPRYFEKPAVAGH